MIQTTNYTACGQGDRRTTTCKGNVGFKIPKPTAEEENTDA